MLPVALQYPPGDCNGFRVYRPARGGKSCERFGGYKTINRIPLPLFDSNIACSITPNYSNEQSYINQAVHGKK